MKEIALTTINAKWIHPSLALRLLKANLGLLEDRCEIIEFTLRHSLVEMTEPFINSNPLILGISVSIWNHTAVIKWLEELELIWTNLNKSKPVVILGGPEVSYLPEQAEIFRYADYVIRGEGETAFRKLCEGILSGNISPGDKTHKFINAENINISTIKNAYHLYTDQDVAKKLIYIEASRGCLFNCEFCLSAVKDGFNEQSSILREYPLEPFLAEMDILVQRGARTFKFLDRTFNINIKRAIRIMEFFLERIDKQIRSGLIPLVVHFEMAASLFPQELRPVLSRFPPGTLRLEVGIQTLNPEIAARINRPSNPDKELEAIRFLSEKTHVIIHADLIAGLPGEDLESFGRGFDSLWNALSGGEPEIQHSRIEIQLGILKLLPGAPISRHNDFFKMRYSPLPPYEVMETSTMSEDDLKRIKNYARFWELIINRYKLPVFPENSFPVFEKFLTLSDSLYTRFGQNWGIDKKELIQYVIQGS